MIRSTGTGLSITAPVTLFRGTGLSITAPVCLFRGTGLSIKANPPNHSLFNSACNPQSRGPGERAIFFLTGNCRECVLKYTSGQFHLAAPRRRKS